MMNTMARLGPASALALMAMLAGCNAVFGIDQARLDPSLTDATAPADTNPGALDAAADAASDEAEGEADVATSSDGGTEPGAVTCGTYCAEVIKNCSGTLTEYSRESTCLEMCKLFDVGVVGNTASDSLACRAFHAQAAATDPSGHCRAAGPAGGGVCGTDPCVAFCALTMARCSADKWPTPPYPDGQTCVNTCRAKYAYVTDTAGDLSLTDGPTLNCRLWHLDAVYQADNDSARSHCDHVSVSNVHCN